MPGITTYLWTGALVGLISAAVIYWTGKIKPRAPVGWTASHSKTPWLCHITKNLDWMESECGRNRLNKETNVKTERNILHLPIIIWLHVPSYSFRSESPWQYTNFKIKQHHFCWEILFQLSCKIFTGHINGIFTHPRKPKGKSLVSSPQALHL